MDFIANFYSDIQSLANELDTPVVIVISINILLIIFAKRILQTFSHTSELDKKSTLQIYGFRALNLLIIISFTYYHTYSSNDETSVGFKLLSISILVYLSYLGIHVINYLMLIRYGRVRDHNGQKEYIATYNSRLISIIFSAFVSIIILLSIVRILGYSSLLEAGGVIGFIGILLALTQAAWAPDIFSGLIILNSRMAEVGDVIEFSDGHKSLGVIHKTKVFHTEILSLVNNHRIMIKNSRLRDHTIHNLSKFASAKGLRENLHFKISYEESITNVKAMFNEAFERAIKDVDIGIQEQYPLEIGVENTGDFAVEWVIYYYTKDLKQLLRTRQSFLKLILKTSIEFDISLATPTLHTLEQAQTMT